MVILGIESTCDETAAALVADGVNVISNVVATQYELHQKFRGVVPEVASRAHIERITLVLRQALAEGQKTVEQLDAIAVAHRPGLIGSLLIGVTAAKTLAWTLGKPLIGIDHVQAHLYSACLWVEAASVGQIHPDRMEFPAVGLVASGGHTAIYLMHSFEDVVLVGKTIDDAVGEAYDKVAAVLGLPYPGGPYIDKLAAGGDPAAIDFPRSMLDKDSLDVSFSGLKTSVLYHVRGKKGIEREVSALSDTELADVAASFQAACVDVLIAKLRRAIKRFGAKCVVIGGGVTANSGLRAALPKLGLPVHMPLRQFCTDNAAMTAGLAAVYLRSGRTSELALDAVPFSAIGSIDAGGVSDGGGA